MEQIQRIRLPTLMIHNLRDFFPGSQKYCPSGSLAQYVRVWFDAHHFCCVSWVLEKAFGEVFCIIVWKISGTTALNLKAVRVASHRIEGR